MPPVFGGFEIEVLAKVGPLIIDFANMGAVTLKDTGVLCHICTGQRRLIRYHIFRMALSPSLSVSHTETRVLGSSRASYRRQLSLCGTHKGIRHT